MDSESILLTFRKPLVVNFPLEVWFDSLSEVNGSFEAKSYNIEKKLDAVQMFCPQTRQHKES